MTRTLPHDKYIEHVVDALGAAGLEIADGWTSDAETRGVYCYLDAVITLDPETSGLDEDRWPNGLLLIWEWHTGIEHGEPERGPSWEWAEKRGDHGGNEQPEPLPIEGFANPAQLAAAVHELITTGKAVKSRPGQWNGTAALEAACEKWADEEADSDA
ncbi:hypothetical protein ACFWDI_18980 [Streptomyces sp. NPDC060064]|uniref:hypothetical protein n=1 Tax=Streptomyces sp. NPDC060064 TaxID=3347049 RepID=UPI00368CF733